MVSGTRDNPPPRDNFTERLYGVVSCELQQLPPLAYY